MRPRNALLSACPWLSREEASEALRQAGGDVEKAKRAASAARRHKEERNLLNGRSSGGSAASAAASAEPSALAGKKGKCDTSHARNNEDSNSSTQTRAPPRHSAPINNLSDRQYCCVWSVEVYEDGYRPDVARSLLARVARHVNPVLRDRGWRVKRLIESSSTQWIGLCTSNGRNDADAASTNIQLNLRVRADRKCTKFRTFHQVLAVMLHEITHTSIGLEDIHPPAFWELLDEIKGEYRKKLAAGEVDLETDDYGCNGQYIDSSGRVSSISNSAADLLGNGANYNLDLLGTAGSEGDCGASKRRRRRGRGGKGWGKKNYRKGQAKGYTSNVPQKGKKRPLLKGAKMLDKRTKHGKAAMAEREALSSRELAARAALRRFGGGGGTATCTLAPPTSLKENNAPLVQDLTHEGSDSSSDYDSENNDTRASSAGKKGGAVYSDDEYDEDDDESIREHDKMCACRSCDWSKMFSLLD